MNSKIKRLVAYFIRIYGTNDPFAIADYMGVTIIRMPLDDIGGFYKLIKRRKYIFLNSDIKDDSLLKVITAHELGHAILHPKENCAFMKSHTLLLTSKIEVQANTFAAYLLIDNDIIAEYAGYTKEQFCNCTGYPKELIELRLK